MPSGRAAPPLALCGPRRGARSPLIVEACAAAAADLVKRIPSFDLADLVMPVARSPWRGVAAAAVLALAGLASTAPAQAVPAGGPPSTNVAWLSAAADPEVDAAFARARSERKPLLLYWGASWCPPCNQLKATLFNRQDFAALSQGFVAVHVDGDKPGAQKVGARFNVSAYPTLVLLAADGRELTRLPGEVEPAQVLAALQAAMAGGRPAATVLADARAGRPLSPADWRLLAYYAWDTDARPALVPKQERAALLADLARRSVAQPDAALTTRLWLQSLAADEPVAGGAPSAAASGGGSGAASSASVATAAAAPIPDAAQRARLLALLADPVRSRQQMDLLVNWAGEIVARVAPPAAASGAEAGPGAAAATRPPAPGPTAAPGASAAGGQGEIVAAFDRALARLQSDVGLSRGDRVGALIARVELARADQPEDALHPRIPEALQREVREQAARFDAEIRDGYERQAVITSVAYLEGRAGLWAESEALLKANLAKSHSPYYLMSQLGSQARRQGRHAEALDWYAQAWQRSVGPATRLQWGAGYLSALIDLAPDDLARIERTAGSLLDEAAADPAAFHERSATALARAGRKLAGWSGQGAAEGPRAQAVGRLRSRLDGTCRKLEGDAAQRTACEAVLPSPNTAGRGAAGTG